jgi:hypothetical protein
MWTKRQLCNEAFAELGLASYEFELTPEELQSAVRRLDSMMAEWQQRGINLGYSLPGSPDGSDLNADSGLPDYAASAVYLGLACKLGPQFGKTVTQETKTAAKAAYDPLLWAAAMPTQQQYPSTLPVGAGNRAWRWSTRPFFPQPDTSSVREAGNDNLDFLEG